MLIPETDNRCVSNHIDIFITFTSHYTQQKQEVEEGKEAVVKTEATCNLVH